MTRWFGRLRLTLAWEREVHERQCRIEEAADGR